MGNLNSFQSCLDRKNMDYQVQTQQSREGHLNERIERRVNYKAFSLEQREASENKPGLEDNINNRTNTPNMQQQNEENEEKHHKDSQRASVNAPPKNFEKSLSSDQLQDALPLPLTVVNTESYNLNDNLPQKDVERLSNSEEGVSNSSSDQSSSKKPKKFKRSKKGRKGKNKPKTINYCNLPYQNGLSSYSTAQPKSYNLMQETELLPLGLKNIESNCYLNTAIQLLRQIQHYNPSFLLNRPSNLAIRLFNFFHKLDQQRKLDIGMLEYLLEMSKKMNNHLSVDVCTSQALLNILNTIHNEIKAEVCPSSDNSGTTPFQDYFVLCYQDGIQCLECKQFCKDNSEYSCYENEKEEYRQISHFEDITKLNSIYSSDFDSLDHFCLGCGKSTKHLPKKILKFYPQFIIVKFPYERKLFLDEDKCQSFSFNQEGNSVSYELIGYTNYYGCHYTYTGKYDNEWITFNDSSVYECQLNLSSAINLLYIKCD